VEGGGEGQSEAGATKATWDATHRECEFRSPGDEASRKTLEDEASQQQTQDLEVCNREHASTLTENAQVYGDDKMGAASALVAACLDTGDAKIVDSITALVEIAHSTDAIADAEPTNSAQGMGVQTAQMDRSEGEEGGAAEVEPDLDDLNMCINPAVKYVSQSFLAEIRDSEKNQSKVDDANNNAALRGGGGGREGEAIDDSHEIATTLMKYEPFPGSLLGVDITTKLHKHLIFEYQTAISIKCRVVYLEKTVSRPMPPPQMTSSNRDACAFVDLIGGSNKVLLCATPPPPLSALPLFPDDIVARR